MAEVDSGQWDHSVDVLIVGSGNGGLTAALCNYEMGSRDVLVVEKGNKVGGTSAVSGGGIWIPCTHYSEGRGIPDSIAEAKEYLTHALDGAGIPEDRIDSYLENGPKMLKFLHDRTDVRYESLDHYPDYYTNCPGAKEGNRSLEPVPINCSELGEDYKRMIYTHHMMRLFGLIHFTQVEAQILTVRMKGWLGITFRLIGQYLIDIPWRLKTKISRRLCCGSAGVARLFLSTKKRDIPIWFESAFKDLIIEGGRVVGAVVEHEGKAKRIQARKGLILAAGGFEHNQQMREQYLPKPTNAEWSAGVRTNTGDAIRAGIKAGAQTSQMDGAWWCTTLCVPDEERPRLSIMEKSCPGSCVVNAKGERFANESQNYIAFQHELFAAHSDESPCSPAYHIFDAQFRRNYIAGPLMTASLKPDWTIPQDWFDRGFVAKADTIEELAEKLGIDAAGLRATVDKMNHYAKTGVDEDFQRGDSAYDRYYADPNIKPNPCLATIAEAPFYAMRIDAGDFGTLGGMVTDCDARVQHEDGSAIEGLFAIGNCSSAILPNYPGPGSTLGPSMTMAYQASKFINGFND